MLKFPHEYQLDSKDCGPACIKIIAKPFHCIDLKRIMERN